jgi:hypothetical protein
MPYVFIRLENGAALPYSAYASMGRDAAYAFGITTFELYKEVARRGGGRMPDGGGELANFGFMCGLWHYEYAPLPCEARVRRHTARTFLPWDRWRADPPDTPGGDFQ